MGKKALAVRKATIRTIRATLLSSAERDYLRTNATYEGSGHHKGSPGDFGLTPPMAPRADKTLCDEAGIHRVAVATELFCRAIDAGLVSDNTVASGMPKHLWVVDGNGRVFEAMYGGSRTGCYHGYPIRRTDPLFDQIIEVWAARQCGT
jgi:hypothetical protein